jgi:hypothetical protein
MKEKTLIDVVAQVIDDKYPEDSYNFGMQPMDKIISTMKELGFEIDEDEMSTNGWQMDFWVGCSLNEKKYQISGSWYYGEYKFSKEG